MIKIEKCNLPQINTFKQEEQDERSTVSICMRIVEDYATIQKIIDDAINKGEELTLQAQYYEMQKFAEIKVCGKIVLICEFTTIKELEAERDAIAERFTMLTVHDTVARTLNT